MWSCYHPVSYTHLDVYKRQLVIIAIISSVIGHRNLKSMYQASNEITSVYTVSYTHLSVLFLLTLSPLLLVIAVCIKCEDGGSVIYRQVRCTRDMKKFEIYKFRSMITDAEKNRGPQLATKHDKRPVSYTHLDVYK